MASLHLYNSAMKKNEVNIFNAQITPLTVKTLHDHIADYVQTRQRQLILNANIHCLNLAYEHKWLRDFLNQAAIVFCDGAGVIIGAKILGYNIPQRITFADWMWQLAPFAMEQDFSFFFLGGKPGIAEQAAVRLRERFPDLKIAGTHHGYFDKTMGSQENEAIVDQINAIHPNILIVGFGMPLQEKWLLENWERLDVNVILTGGAVFDYISGELRRGPKWMTDNGLEWLARLLIEPRRLWKRYIIGNPKFLWRVCLQRLNLLNLD